MLLLNTLGRVRYVDTGSRDPKHALGTWLGEALLAGPPVAAIRVQTGFFGSGALGYFEGALELLASTDGHTRFLVGSNDGQTLPGAIEDLLAVVGAPRSNLRLGVVSFQTGFFHPKVFHVERDDGSATAYVGSANLTPSGVRSQHVEAGIILDSKEGDPHETLASIASAVDDWFMEMRPGYYPVVTSADVSALVTAGVLGIPSPPRTERTLKSITDGEQKAQLGHSLTPLVAMPTIQRPLARKPPGGKADALDGTASPHVASTPPTPLTGAKRVARWSKSLPPSDAQRREGHQSKLIALTQGDYRRRIDHTTYFRNDLFGGETWNDETTTSKAPLEVAYVPIRTTIDGTDHGVLTFRFTHAIHRESGSNSPTTEVHLEPIASVFAKSDMTGKRVEIERYDNGSYSLTIS